jgi:hypothetical protein
VPLPGITLSPLLSAASAEYGVRGACVNASRASPKGVGRGFEGNTRAIEELVLVASGRCRMGRVGSTPWRFTILLVMLASVAVLPVALAGPASGLPIDKPVDKVQDRLGGPGRALGGVEKKAGQALGGVEKKAGQALGGVQEKAGQALGGVREKAGQALGGVGKAANDALGAVKGMANNALNQVVGGANEAVSEALGPVVEAVEAAVGQGHSGSPASEPASDRLQADIGRDEGARDNSSSGAAASADEGDVDELARGGNEIQSGSQQQGVGINFPLPQAGGENRPLLGFTGLNLLLAVALALVLAGLGAMLLEADQRRLATVVAPG